MPLVAIVFGWPAVIGSVLATAFGIALGRWTYVLAGAIVGTPFLLYLLLTPRFGLIAPAVMATQLGAVYAVARGHRLVAIALAMPFVVLAAWLARLVLNQFSA